MCQPGNPRPHGESHSCWRTTPGARELPQREVGRVALGLDLLDPAAGGELVEVEAGEVGVAGEGRHVEVHAVVDHVGVALRLQRADHRDLLVDVRGRLGQHVGLEAAEPGPVVGPLLRVEGGDLGGGLPGGGRRLLHLVLALVGVGHEVADVGDVGDERDVVARRQRAPGGAGRGRAGCACCRGAAARTRSARRCRCRPAAGRAARRAAPTACGCRTGAGPRGRARARSLTPDHGR